MFTMRRIIGLVGVMAAVGLLATVASAQTSQQTIGLGESKMGQITSEDPAPAFVFNAGAGQSLNVLVLSQTAGFAPALLVFDPNGMLAQDQPNNTAAQSLQVAVTTTVSGNYQFVVQTANGAGGQFVIFLQGVVVQAPPPLILPLNTPVTDSVGTQAPTRRYAFNALSTDIVTLRMTSASTVGGPSVSLIDTQTGDVLATSSSRMIESSFRIPLGIESYTVEVSAGSAGGAQQFTIILETGTGPTLPTPVVVSTAIPTVIPTEAPPGEPTLVPLPVAGACVVASQGAERINVRGGPSTGYAVVTQMTLSQIVPVIGRQGDNSWYQVSVNGLTGWVAAFVVRIGGDCSTVPVIVLPTVIPPSPAPVSTIPVEPTIPPIVTSPPLVVTLNPGILTAIAKPTLKLQIQPHFLVTISP